MMAPAMVRPSAAADRPAIADLYPLAFPDEPLWPLVVALLEPGVEVLSLVAERDGQLTGHGLFTRCDVDGQPVSLLGPLAVAPDAQRQGIGSALVGAGLARLRAEGVRQVQVLGDPAYYGRLGFKPDRQVSPPYPLPDGWADAWQSQRLGDWEALAGRLRVPQPWMVASLWQ